MTRTPEGLHIGQDEHGWYIQGGYGVKLYPMDLVPSTPLPQVLDSLGVRFSTGGGSAAGTNGKLTNPTVWDWSAFEPYGNFGTLHFGKDSLYSADGYGAVWSINPFTGELREFHESRQGSDTYYAGNPIAENSEHVFIATLGRETNIFGRPTGSLEAVDKTSGATAWQTGDFAPLNVFKIQASEEAILIHGARADPNDPEDYVHFLQAFDADSGQELWVWERKHIQVFELAGPRAMASWYDGHKVNGMTLDSLTGESPP